MRLLPILGVGPLIADPNKFAPLLRRYGVCGANSQVVAMLNAASTRLWLSDPARARNTGADKALDWGRLLEAAWTKEEEIELGRQLTKAFSASPLHDVLALEHAANDGALRYFLSGVLRDKDCAKAQPASRRILAPRISLRLEGESKKANLDKFCDLFELQEEVAVPGKKSFVIGNLVRLQQEQVYTDDSRSEYAFVSWPIALASLENFNEEEELRLAQPNEHALVFDGVFTEGNSEREDSWISAKAHVGMGKDLYAVSDALVTKVASREIANRLTRAKWAVEEAAQLYRELLCQTEGLQLQKGAKQNKADALEALSSLPDSNVRALQGEPVQEHIDTCALILEIVRREKGEPSTTPAQKSAPKHQNKVRSA